jgi:hypothetical protein
MKQRQLAPCIVFFLVQVFNFYAKRSEEHWLEVQSCREFFKKKKFFLNFPSNILGDFGFGSHFEKLE